MHKKMRLRTKGREEGVWGAIFVLNLCPISSTRPSINFHANLFSFLFFFVALTYRVRFPRRYVRSSIFPLHFVTLWMCVYFTFPEGAPCVAASRAMFTCLLLRRLLSINVRLFFCWLSSARLFILRYINIEYARDVYCVWGELKLSPRYLHVYSMKENKH